MKVQKLVFMVALLFAVSTGYTNGLSEGAMDMAKDAATDKAESTKEDATEATTEKAEDTKKGVIEKAKDKAMEMGGKLMGKYPPLTKLVDLFSPALSFSINQRHTPRYRYATNQVLATSGKRDDNTAANNTKPADHHRQPSRPCT